MITAVLTSPGTGEKKHTYQYLNFKSNNHVEHKRYVVRTLLKRADVLVTKPDNKALEVVHVK